MVLWILPGSHSRNIRCLFIEWFANTIYAFIHLNNKPINIEHNRNYMYIEYSAESCIKLHILEWAQLYRHVHCTCSKGLCIVHMYCGAHYSCVYCLLNGRGDSVQLCLYVMAICWLFHMHVNTTGCIFVIYNFPSMSWAELIRFRMRANERPL